MSDEGPVVGRDTELAMLERMLTSAQSGLVLLVGEPTTGKARLLRELRARAAAYPCTLVPGNPSGDVEAPRLVIDKQSTVDDFRRATAPPSDDEVNREQMRRRDFDLILVYGYRPEEDFREWFTGEFLPGLAGASPPRVVVVAGNASDVAGLESLANRKVVLGPLPREAVVAELQAIDAAIADRLQERELEVYADAITTNPSLLDALRHLLPLTSDSWPLAGIDEGE